MNENKSQKRLLIIFGCCSVIALAICLGVVVLVAGTQRNDGVYERVVNPDNNPVVFADGENLLRESLAAPIDKDFARYDVSRTLRISDFELTDADDAQKELWSRYISKINDNNPVMNPGGQSFDFGDEKENGIVSAYPDGYTLEDALLGDSSGEKYNDDGKVRIKAYKEATENLTAYPAADEIFSELAEIAEFKNIKYAHTYSEKDFVLSPADKTLESIRTLEKISVSGTLAYKDGLASLGEFEFSFTVNAEQKQSFKYAAIAFSKDAVTVAPGQSAELPVKAAMKDGDEYEVKFSSADESIVTIDEMGYVTAVKESAEPVEVTVTFIYRGKEFTDTALVYAVTAVEKIRAEESSLEMKTGETVTLSYEITPDNATVKTVTCETEGDDIITANAKDGSVGITAVKAGECTLVLIAEDGSDYCAKINITVKGE